MLDAAIFVLVIGIQNIDIITITFDMLVFQDCFFMIVFAFLKL